MVSLSEDLVLLALAVAVDGALREPPAPLHPVVLMGRVVSAAERRAPMRGRWAPLLFGGVMALGVPAVFGGAAWGAAWGLHRAGPAAYFLVGGLLLKATFAVRALMQAGLATARDLERHDLTTARHSLRSLVSREASTLAPPMVAAAAIESVAENSTDSYVAPWLAFALFGLPGAFAYRAVNTLDSMVGYRGRYEWLGKASARLDDLLNLAPARLSAVLMLAAGEIHGLPLLRGLRTMRRDARLTASPNAGWTMSAMAGLLGVRLEKASHYVLGREFPEPGPVDVRRAVWVTPALAVLALGLAAGVLVARHALVG